MIWSCGVYVGILLSVDSTVVPKQVSKKGFVFQIIPYISKCFPYSSTQKISQISHLSPIDLTSFTPCDFINFCRNVVWAPPVAGARHRLQPPSPVAQKVPPVPQSQSARGVASVASGGWPPWPNFLGQWEGNIYRFKPYGF